MIEGLVLGLAGDVALLPEEFRWGFEFQCTDAPPTTKVMRIALDCLGPERLRVVYPGRTAYPLGERIGGRTIANRE